MQLLVCACAAPAPAPALAPAHTPAPAPAPSPAPAPAPTPEPHSRRERAKLLISNLQCILGFAVAFIISCPCLPSSCPAPFLFLGSVQGRPCARGQNKVLALVPPGLALHFCGCLGGPQCCSVLEPCIDGHSRKTTRKIASCLLGRVFPYCQSQGISKAGDLKQHGGISGFSRCPQRWRHYCGCRWQSRPTRSSPGSMSL